MDEEMIPASKASALADIFHNRKAANLGKPTDLHTGIAVGRKMAGDALNGSIQMFEDSNKIPVSELVHLYRMFRAKGNDDEFADKSEKEKGFAVGYRRSASELAEFIDNRVEDFNYNPEPDSAEDKSLSATVSQDSSEHLGSGPDEAVEKNSSAEDVFNLGDNNE